MVQLIYFQTLAQCTIFREGESAVQGWHQKILCGANTPKLDGHPLHSTVLCTHYTLLYELQLTENTSTNIVYYTPLYIVHTLCSTEFLKDAIMQLHICAKYFRICLNCGLMNAKQETKFFFFTFFVVVILMDVSVQNFKSEHFDRATKALFVVYYTVYTPLFCILHCTLQSKNYTLCP